MTPSILILGSGQHGKDTFAELLVKYNPNLSFESSSWAIADKLFADFAPIYGYLTVEECYEDRANHRDEWFKWISNFNTPDKTALARLILSKNNIYVGLRNKKEYEACVEAYIFNHIFWVDALNRLPPEPESSFNIKFDPRRMLYVDNNKSLDHLENQAALQALNLA